MNVFELKKPVTLFQWPSLALPPPYLLSKNGLNSQTIPGQMMEDMVKSFGLTYMLYPRWTKPNGVHSN